MNTKDILSQLNDVRDIINNCIDSLSDGKKPTIKIPSVKVKREIGIQPIKLNFGLNERNFIKTYAKGLSGGKKFTLLLAFIVKGKIGVDVELSIVRTKWNKMTAENLMRYEFNSKYPTEAKTHGWVDSKKLNFYHLQDEWKDIFS